MSKATCLSPSHRSWRERGFLRWSASFARRSIGRKRRGIRLSHLDSHMGTLFRSRELFDTYRRIGDAYGLPVLIERQGDRGGAQASWQTSTEPDALIDRVVSISPASSRPTGRQPTRSCWRRSRGCVPADRPPRLRRRRNARRHVGRSRLGRGMATVGPEPDQESGVPAIPEAAGVRAGYLEAVVGCAISMTWFALTLLSSRRRSVRPSHLDDIRFLRSAKPNVHTHIVL